MSLQIPEQLRPSKFSPNASSKESIFIPSASRNVSIMSRRHLNVLDPSIQNSFNKAKGAIITLESRSRAQSQDRRPENNKKELDISLYTQNELMEVGFLAIKVNSF